MEEGRGGGGRGRGKLVEEEGRAAEKHEGETQDIKRTGRKIRDPGMEKRMGRICMAKTGMQSSGPSQGFEFRLGRVSASVSVRTVTHTHTHALQHTRRPASYTD
jgi:hypothetical protein